MQLSYAVDSHYSQIRYLQINLFAKIYMYDINQ